ncbi:MAG: acyltransferase family protein [Actinomycetes bacterium]
MTVLGSTGEVAATSATTNRRADIQGLRALAVGMVVAYHSGLPFPGGFVGVDVFFVISGYVITAMIGREFAERGRFDFRRFYRRRFQRLTPALAVMVGFVVLASVVLLSPLGPQQTAQKTGLGSLVLVANVVIAKTTGGYFDAPAAANPLLNTWSLSVEEQFYLVFPIVLLAGWLLASRFPRLGPARWMTVGAVGTLSLVLALVGAGHVLSTTPWLLGYYSPLTRAWEFAAGAILALLISTRRRPSGPMATVLGLAGLMALAVTIWSIDGTTPFPGLWTLVPVAATVALLAAGLTPSNIVSRVLALRPFTIVGDVSYSWYLWHWPFIVFAIVVWPGDPTVPVIAALVAAVPAIGSYRWVEQPIRSLRPPRPVMRNVALVVVPVLVITAASLVLSERVLRTEYATGRAGHAWPGAVGWSNLSELDRTFPPCNSPGVSFVVADATSTSRCHLPDPAAGVEVVVVGDSHGQHLLPGLRQVFPHTNILYQPIDTVLSARLPDSAVALRLALREPSVRTVIVNSYWFNHVWSGPDLTAALRELVSAGKSVFLTDDVPDFPFNAARCKYDTPLLGRRCSESAVDFAARHRQYLGRLRTAAAVPGVRVVPTARYFCHGTRCSMNRGRKNLFRDDNHLNFRGSRYLVSRLARDNPDVVAAVTGSDR